MAHRCFLIHRGGTEGTRAGSESKMAQPRAWHLAHTQQQLSLNHLPNPVTPRWPGTQGFAKCDPHNRNYPPVPTPVLYFGLPPGHTRLLEHGNPLIYTVLLPRKLSPLLPTKGDPEFRAHNPIQGHTAASLPSMFSAKAQLWDCACATGADITGPEGMPE